MTAREHDIWQALVRIHRLAQQVMDGIEAEATARLVTLVERVSADMLQELGLHPERVRLETVQSIGRILDSALARGVDVMVEAAASAAETGAGAAVSGLVRFGGLSPQKLDAIAGAFRDNFVPNAIAAGRARWYGRLSDEVFRPQSALMQALVDARIRGRSLRDSARRLLELDPSLSELPPSGNRLSASARSLMVVRSESNQVLNTAGVLFNQEAGIDNFRNFGIGDDRQSDVCWLACLAPAMTLEKWATYEAGPKMRPVPWQKRVKVRLVPRQVVDVAGRHPNCRCQMVGIPAALKPSRELLVEAGLIPAAA